MNVVLLPLKSRRYHSSSDCRCKLLTSTGAQEFGECVNAPATLMFLERYFFAWGNMHPDKPNANPAKAVAKAKRLVWRDRDFIR